MRNLFLGFLILGASSVMANTITVEGLPVVKMKVKSSLNLPSGQTTDLSREQNENKNAAIQKLKSYIESELGKKVVGDGECKILDFRATYPSEGGRAGWILHECSVSFI